MAYDRKITSYEVRPVDFNGKLDGLALFKEVRVQRVSDSGAILDAGWGSYLNEEIVEIPISKVPNLIGQMVDWLAWYAKEELEEK